MNLTFLGLCIACMGVYLSEGLLWNGLFKSVARQNHMLSEFRSLMFLGVAFIEGELSL